MKGPHPEPCSCVSLRSDNFVQDAMSASVTGSCKCSIFGSTGNRTACRYQRHEAYGRASKNKVCCASTDPPQCAGFKYHRASHRFIAIHVHTLSPLANKEKKIKKRQASVETSVHPPESGGFPAPCIRASGTGPRGNGARTACTAWL